MQKYQDVVLSRNGTPIQGAVISVTDTQRNTVPVYGVNQIGTADINPVVSDGNGRFFFYAPDGRYNLIVSFSGNTVATVTDILLEDPEDGSDAVFGDVTVDNLTVNTSLSDASKVGFTPAGGIVADDVQAAIQELDTEKASSAALAASGGSNLVGYLPAGTGAVATDVQSKLREFVSRADYDSDANYKTARAALSGRLDHALRVEGGTTDRLLSAKLAEVPSVVDAGADTTGIASSNTAFTSAAQKIVVPSGTFNLSGAVARATFEVAGRVNVVGNGGFWIDGTAEKDRFNVSRRAPVYRDCVNYAVGDTWQVGGVLWTANRVTAGSRASWTTRRSVADSLITPTGTLGHWWVKRVVPTYTGPCLRIRSEATGVETDIGFDESGILDLRVIRPLIVGTRARVVTFYDQSGLGNHLTTSSNDSQPVLEPYPDETGLPRIVFETSVIYKGSAVTPQVLNIPLGVATNSNNVYIGALVKCAHSTRDAPIIELDGTTRVALGKRRQSGIESVVAYVNNSARAVTGRLPNLGPEFLAVASATGGVRSACGDDRTDSAAVSAVALAGGRIGTSTNLFLDGLGNPRSGGFALYGLIIRTAAATSIVANVFAAVCRDFNLAPQKRGVVVIDGDSITEGAFAVQFRNWPALVSNEYSAIETRYYNVAISGGTSSSQITGQAQWLSSFSSMADRKTAVVCFGSNDIKGGTSAATLFANLQTYLANVQAAGFNTIVATLLPRQGFDAAKETERLAYNQMLRDQYKTTLSCVSLLDFAIEPTMGSASNVSNTTYYADGTHPTAFGLELLACYAAEVINTELISGAYSG